MMTRWLNSDVGTVYVHPRVPSQPVIVFQNIIDHSEQPSSENIFIPLVYCVLRKKKK